ncbi:MAG TPA: pyridoxamine 5'-phosphate oxidase family protein [Bacteroidales bacterium]|nr:pyridoxamine 5'-phosphate oxidase family protein [Bacteroidales bacterium]
MKQQVFDQIAAYLLGQKKMTLSTVTAEGQPIAHTVQYASSGNTVYFFTKPSQRKVTNIKNNPRVGYAVDRDYDDWSKIQGVQMTGIARVLENEQEVDEAFSLISSKFPHMAAIGKAFLEHHVIVEVKPVEGRFIDNTVHFGYYGQTDYM